ncbi:winged helix-turn-helix transcriptional regulator [Paenibacillus sp. 7523-1]|uniref:winged helix-turn-helix transcriptional regulator n=1 Tax=Paenibacillus sp. 7523-1 TaxID=2022550 RepID=UPI0026C151F5
MARHQYDPNNMTIDTVQQICPLTKAQDVIAGRWKIIILSHLHEHGVIRFNDLLRMIPGVSKGILTRQLRELEEDGAVHREVYKVVPPKVEYSLTEQGKQFLPVLEAMRVWGKTFLNS